MKIGGQIWAYRTTENVRRETWCTGQQAGQGNRGGFAWAIRGSSSGRLCASRYCQARQARLRPVGVVSCWTRFVSSGPRLQAEVPSCDMFVQHLHAPPWAVPHAAPEPLCGWLNVRVTAAPVSRSSRPYSVQL